MYTYSRLLDHPLALDARIEIYRREATGDRIPHWGVHRYPAQHVSRWKMKNGEETVFRPIRPDDEPLMANFHKTLSEQERLFALLSYGKPERASGERASDSEMFH